MWFVWPVRVFLEGAESLARISEHEAEKTEEQRTEEGIEALVEAAEEEGIIEPEQADLIEQVVEFSDKRVREVMTPRPSIVAMPADATLEDLHAKVVETKLNKIPVYEETLDDIFGVVYSQDLLQIADQDLPKRKVRELVKPVLFIPETKIGSELLREMRQKGQPLAVVIDEHGRWPESRPWKIWWKRSSAKAETQEASGAGCGARTGWRIGDARQHADRRRRGITWREVRR